MTTLPRWLLVAQCVLAAGCTTVSDTDCRNANWYDVGFRDAILALQRQEDTYAEACARHGIKVDSARYTQGWIEGKYEADQRHPQPTH
jgi:hypothetical protein